MINVVAAQHKIHHKSLGVNHKFKGLKSKLPTVFVKFKFITSHFTPKDPNTKIGTNINYYALRCQ